MKISTTLYRSQKKLFLQPAKVERLVFFYRLFSCYFHLVITKQQLTVQKNSMVFEYLRMLKFL